MPRSYPDGMGEDEIDALAYSPAGFLWDNALRHGMTLRNYGEFCHRECAGATRRRTGTPRLPGLLPDLEGRERRGRSSPASRSIETITAVLAHRLRRLGDVRARPVPRRLRHRELAEFEARGEFPQLTIICLPNDHTSGTSPGCPTPAACVADNDLAFGRIVEALSHSPVLAADGDLRHRGRSAGRLGPRQRLPHHGLL